MDRSTHERLRELAQFLRTRRTRITPEQAGLPAGGRRRTPGLRRGEVAMLSGISVDWYTWLEQGRNIRVSAQFVGDPWWMELIGDLNRASAEFREWWPQHDVLGGPEGRKVNYHPQAGRLVFEQLSFLVSESPHLTVTINIPSCEDGSAARMDSLLR